MIHVVPFLLKIWQKKDFQLENVSDEDLQNAGIKNEKDRKGVLKAISDFLATSYRNEKDECASSAKDVPGPSDKPTAPQEGSPKSPTLSASSFREHPADAVNAVECVVCMDAQVRVIFLPCGKFHLIALVRLVELTFRDYILGHLCCCIDCATDLVDCPMCRASIDRKIRVIQP